MVIKVCLWLIVIMSRDTTDDSCCILVLLIHIMCASFILTTEDACTQE